MGHVTKKGRIAGRPSAEQRKSVALEPVVDEAELAQIIERKPAHMLVPAARDLVLDAFVRAGGRKRFTQWARSNPTEFYTRILPKVIPQEITGPGGGDFKVIVETPTEPAQAVAGVMNSPIAGATKSDG